MILDTVTILIGLGVLCLSFALVMLLIWKRFSSGPSMLLWSLGMGCWGAESILISLRDRMSLLLSCVIGDLLLVCGFCLVWWGVSLYRGVEPCRRVILGSMVAFSALLLWFTWANPDIAVRLLLMRGFTLFYLGGALVTLAKRGQKSLAPMERLLTAALLINLLSVVLQITGVFGSEPLRNNAHVAFTALLALVGVTCWGLSVVLVRLESLVDDARALEKRAWEAKTLLETIIDNLPSLIWMSGPDRGCTWFNQAWLGFTGRSLEQELGYGWADGVHPDDLHRCLQVYGDSFDARRPFSMEYRLRRHDGDYRWLLDQGQPRHDASGDFCGFIGSCLDVTERYQAVELLKLKNQEIEQFIYTVSHDLRSPLVTIKSFTGFLEQDIEIADSTRIGQDLHFIHTAAGKMEQLLVELLEFSRIDRRENPAQRVSFRELVGEALSLVAGQIINLKAKVQVEEQDLLLTGDRPRLIQIWQNLLDNAVKYMGEQPAPLVQLGIARRDDEVVFYVRDNGIGIEPEHRDRVFVMFDKLDQQSSGVGLGLSMVKRIVEKYKGRIWVESAGKGCGSCFSFTLPEALIGEGER